MATFTMPLKDVVRRTDDIGLNDYPIFDESYREGLNKKIIDHYWNQEIGLETVDLFIFALRRKMNEIMPKYNAVYKAQARQIDPLINFKTVSTAINDQSGKTETADTQETVNNVDEVQSSTSTNDSDNKSRTVTSEFPQQALSDTGDYASSAADSVSSATVAGTTESQAGTVGSSTGTGASTNTSQVSASVEQSSEGFSGTSFASMVAEYSDLFINTDMEIVRELSTLFMLIWASGESYFDDERYYR